MIDGSQVLLSGLFRCKGENIFRVEISRVQLVFHFNISVIICTSFVHPVIPLFRQTTRAYHLLEIFRVYFLYLILDTSHEGVQWVSFVVVIYDHGVFCLGTSFGLGLRINAVRVFIVIVNFEVANGGLSVGHGHIDGGHVTKHLKLTLRFDRIVHRRRRFAALE